MPGAGDLATYARFLFPLAIMALGLTAGYVVKLRRTADCLPLSRRFTRTGMIYLDPINITLALWGQSLAEPRMFVLPVMGLAIALLATVPAWIATRARRTAPRRAGVLVGASLLSNLGPTFGTFLAFVLAGERGFAAATLFTVYFYPTFYTLGLLVGRRYSSGGDVSPARFIADAMRDAANRNPVLAVFVGLLLGAFGPARPEWLAGVTPVLVPLTTLVYLVGIGMTLNPSRIRDYIPHSAAIGAVKFVFTPLLGLGFAGAYRALNPGDAISPQVIFLQSCMPTAIFSLIMANLFDLDRDLANTLWLTTNGVAIVLSPAILWLAGMV